MSAYKEPEWGVVPTTNEKAWSLIEIKNGVEVAKHDLSDRPTTILGRAANMVHVPLHHESISRQHARISFDGHGNYAWLKDLQSAHGTFVNRKRLPSEASSKVESNSHQKGVRGIKIFAGDLLRFGASSRYFVLEGPQRQEEKPIVPKQKASLESKVKHSTVTQQTSLVGGRDSNSEGISWGISMEEDTENDETSHLMKDDSSKTLDDPQKIPEKYRSEWNKLNALKYKLSNLETEDGRIRRKGGELTEGQERQLQRNAEKEAKLRASILEREESLYDKIHNIRKSSRSLNETSRNSAVDDDEEDDYFDRTKNNSGAFDSASEEVESEESLTIKWKECVEERTKLENKALTNATKRVKLLKEHLRTLRASGDEEAFFVQNDLHLAVEARKKVESLLVKYARKMDEIEKLLKVVNPKLCWDRAVGYIGEGKPTDTSTSKQPNNYINDQNHRQAEKSVKEMQPPPSMPPPHAADKPMPPPPKIPTATTKPNPEYPMPPPTKRKRVTGPVVEPSAPPKPGGAMGTLAYLNRVETSSAKISAPLQPKQQEQLTMGAASDVWRAPEGQDGSGRTKLNDKFAGRY